MDKEELEEGICFLGLVQIVQVKQGSGLMYVFVFIVASRM